MCAYILRKKRLSLKRGFGRCGHGLSGFGGCDGFGGFYGFSFVYSITKDFISCAELPSTYTWLKDEPQPCSMDK